MLNPATRNLAFSVEGTHDLLGLLPVRAWQSSDVKGQAVEKAARSRQKIRGLKAMLTTLETLADCWAGNDRPDCPILRDFE